VWSGSSSVPVNTVPDTPYVYVGPPRIASTLGSWTILEYHFPLHYLLARLSGDEAVDQAAINDALDLVLAQFTLGITLGIAGVVSAEIKTGDTDKFYTIGTQQYQAVDLDVVVTWAGPKSPTP
jgi:hypothetical protein